MSDRPIASSCNSATENISRFLDTYHQPAVKQLPSYIKDTKDFVLFIESLQITKNTILATFDVSSLTQASPMMTAHYMQNKHTAKHLVIVLA